MASSPTRLYSEASAPGRLPPECDASPGRCIEALPVLLRFLIREQLRRLRDRF